MTATTPDNNNNNNRQQRSAFSFYLRIIHITSWSLEKVNLFIDPYMYLSECVEIANLIRTGVGSQGSNSVPTPF